MGRLRLATSVALIVVAACSAEPVPSAEEPAPPWGPLAIYAGPPNGDKALTAGTLEITPACVFLTRQGARELVIWPSIGTAWDDATLTIVFRGSDGVVHRLKNGQATAFGGSGFSVAEDGQPMGVLLARLDWIRPPRPECVTPGIWSVGGVVEP